jgi:hypothetical protein
LRRRSKPLSRTDESHSEVRGFILGQPIYLATLGRPAAGVAVVQMRGDEQPTAVLDLLNYSQARRPLAKASELRAADDPDAQSGWRSRHPLQCAVIDINRDARQLATPKKGAAAGGRDARIRFNLRNQRPRYSRHAACLPPSQCSPRHRTEPERKRRRSPRQTDVRASSKPCGRTLKA